MQSIIRPALQELREHLEDAFISFSSSEEIAKVLGYVPTNHWEICKYDNMLIMIEYNNKDRFRVNDICFRVCREPFDDSICTYVGKRSMSMIKCLVNQESLADFVRAAIFDHDVDQSWLYKNKPKMKSNGYGAQLCDISIVCSR